MRITEITGDRKQRDTRGDTDFWPQLALLRVRLSTVAFPICYPIATSSRHGHGARRDTRDTQYQIETERWSRGTGLAIIFTLLVPSSPPPPHGTLSDVCPVTASSLDGPPSWQRRASSGWKGVRPRARTPLQVYKRLFGGFSRLRTIPSSIT